MFSTVQEKARSKKKEITAFDTSKGIKLSWLVLLMVFTFR